MKCYSLLREYQVSSLNNFTIVGLINANDVDCTFIVFDSFLFSICRMIEVALVNYVDNDS
jgi:hypothetical protein